MDIRMQIIEYETGYYEGETKDNKPNGKGKIEIDFFFLRFRPL